VLLLVSTSDFVLSMVSSRTDRASVSDRASSRRSTASFLSTDYRVMIEDLQLSFLSQLIAVVSSLSNSEKHSYTKSGSRIFSVGPR
jgi:hypothetical protein